MNGAPFDRFVKFRELTENLEGWASSHPSLLRLESIGRSHEGRAEGSRRGWLPTNVTQKAIERKIVRPVEAEITLPDGASLVGTDAKEELGQLSGRVMKNNMSLFGGGADNTTDRAKAEWVVHAPSGAVVALEARHQRAGVARAEITLAG